MARKLREMLGTVTPPMQPVEPTVRVPEVDAAKDLAEAATSGFAAIQALYAERNQACEREAYQMRHNVYLLNVNNGLQAQCNHLHRERDHLMRQNASLIAHLRTAYNAIGCVLGELGQTAMVIEGMGQLPHVTNNPTEPQVDESPLEVEGPPPVDQQELKALAIKLAAANGQAQP